MIYKRCGRCGKRLQQGKKCDCFKQRHKEYDKNRKDKEVHDFYNTPEWKRLRAWAKTHFNNIDIYSYYVLGKYEIGQSVHHIVPIKEDYSLRLSKSNLILLTESNHQLIHERMNSGEREKVIQELKELVKKYEAEFY